MRLDRRHRGFWSCVLLLAVKSWAQPSPPVESAVASGSAEPGGQVQSEAAADVAMAQSAAAAFAKMTGVPTAAPFISGPTVAPADALFPATPYTDAAAGGVPAATLPPLPIAAADTPECKVLAGHLGKAMQVLLFFSSCAALVFKFRRESGNRTPQEFLMDSSKQLIGAGWIHLLNLSFATHLAEGRQAGDECQWYWLNIMLDTTLGVAVVYVLMRFLTTCAQKMQPASADDFETGDYRQQGGACNPVKYFKQLVLYLIVVSLMKCCMYVIMTIGHRSLLGMAEVVLSPFASDAMLKLFVVMVLTPVCMNIFQFWMVDNFIKRHEKDTDCGDLELDGSMRTKIQHGDM